MELEQIPGIGVKTKELLGKLGIFEVEDLISHYPFRYEIIKRSNLQDLQESDHLVIDGIIEGQPTLIHLSTKLKKIILRMNTGSLVLNITIYNRDYLIKSLKSGTWITIIGKYNKIKNTLIASDVRLEKLPATPKIESIYYTTSGLAKRAISRYITSLIVSGYRPKEILPSSILSKYNLLNKYESIIEIHNPTSITSLKRARQRLKYEELFLYLLKINYLKKMMSLDNDAIIRKINHDKIDKFLSTLPYELTPDQKTCLDEIIADMSSSKRMYRLLQGDVGSGKTIIALLATYINYLSKYQTAIMVPTEILAVQHYEEAKKLFSRTHMHIELLTSNITKKNKIRIYQALASGEIDLIIGTQSLIQKDVIFNNLGLIITDEQHRFGVNQRAILQKKGLKPDILSMSATPIPRTYALTIYGDMDISNIKTKPLSRKEVITYFKKEKDIPSVLSMMKKELDQHHQIFVIAPMIENDEREVENVLSLEKKMNLAFGKICKIAILHGRLDAAEKNRIMKKYASSKIDILISTTVIEVGIDVPNATMIVIFDANIFGLSTIHQLRGRVGRSDIQSYCILIAKESHDQLKMLEHTTDGFLISEYDFKNRGEGELFGLKQSGDTGLKLASVKRDYQMLLKAREDVLNFLPIYLQNPDAYPLIKEQLSNLHNIS